MQVASYCFLSPEKKRVAWCGLTLSPDWITNQQTNLKDTRQLRRTVISSLNKPFQNYFNDNQKGWKTRKSSKLSPLTT